MHIKTLPNVLPMHVENSWQMLEGEVAVDLKVSKQPELSCT